MTDNDSRCNECDDRVESGGFVPLGEMLNPNAAAENLRDVLADNVWSYDSQIGLLSCDGYNVHLNRMADATAVVDWIAQVSKKEWATRCVIADLVLALDAILDLQANYCAANGSEYGCRVNPLPIPAEPQS